MKMKEKKKELLTLGPKTRGGGEKGHGSGDGGAVRCCPIVKNVVSENGMNQSCDRDMLTLRALHEVHVL